ncbi:MAG: LysR family transcriptional regulator [Pseudomonadota bacterium]
MDLHSLRLFLRVAELGAVASAGRDLELSPASASARLARLEETVGFRLFHRTTRAVSLTADGAAFLPFAQQAVELLDAGVGALSGQGAEPKGRLRMTMPGSFGRRHVVPALTAFLARYPEVELDLRLSDEVLDVVEGAYDLIIRNAPLADSSMVARRLAADERLLVAAPGYLDEHGRPETPAELAEHRCVVLGDGDRWKFEDGTTMTVPRTIVANDGEASRMLIEQGLGIGIQSHWNAGDELQEGRLVQVLPDAPLLTESAIWALYPSGRLVAPKVRAMMDFLVAHFTQPTWLQAG